VSRRPALAAGLGLCAVAAVWIGRAAVLAGIPSVTTPDSGARIAMIRQLLAGGSLVEAAEPFALNPYAFYLAELPAGTYFIPAPLVPLLSAMPYRLAGPAGLLVVPLLAGLLACAATASAGRRLGLATWPALVPVTGLGTALFFYSVGFWDTALLVACVAFAAAGLARGDARGGVVAGAAFGAGAFFHESVPFLGAIAVVAGLASRPTRRPALAALAAFLPGLAAAALQNVLLYGEPGGAHVQGVNHRDLASLLRGLDPATVWTRAVEQVGGVPASAPAHVVGLLFAIGLFLAARARPASRALLPIALAGGAALSVAADRTNVVVHGLVPATPLLLLALLSPLVPKDPGAGGVPAAWMARSALLYAAGVVLLPIGPGWGWGGRYHLTALPLFVLVAAREVESRLPGTARGAGPLLARAALALVLSGSVVLQLRSTHQARVALNGWLSLREEVGRSPADVVVTDDLSVGPCLVPLGLRKPVLFLFRPGDDALLAPRLERERARTVGWLGSAAGFARVAERLASADPPYLPPAAAPPGSVRLLVRAAGP